LSTPTPDSEPPQTVAPPRAGRFLAAISDERTRITVGEVAKQLGWREPEVHEGGPEVLSALISDPAVPMMLVADLTQTEDAVAAMDALASHCGPETRVIAIGQTNDVSFYRKLLGMGVSDYLVKPIAAGTLTDAIANATRDLGAGGARERKARLVAFIGARGGVGTTSLALSAAWMIAKTKKVAMLDLDLHFGSSALSLDIEAGVGLHDLLAHPERIDGLLVRSAMTTVADGLQILGTEHRLDQHLDVDPEGLSTVLDEVGDIVDFIIVDTPRSLSPMSRQVLVEADTVIIVTDRTLASMRDTRRLIELTKGLRSGIEVLVAVNRAGAVPGEITVANFERFVGAKIDVSVPQDLKAAVAAAERGKPLAETTKLRAFSAAMQQLTTVLAGEQQTVRKPSPLAWLLGG